MKNAVKVIDLINTIWIGVIVVIPAIVRLCLNQLIVDFVMKWANAYASETAAEITGDLSIIVRTMLITTDIIVVITGAVALILSLFGFLRIINGDDGKTPHIFQIVSGGLASAPLGVLGGILGLVSVHKSSKQEVEIEKPEEEIIVDVTEE